MVGTVAERPYVLLSAAMSADGYIDNAGSERLVLSDEADLDRVDELRAGCDAILVGAQTIRADNPRLLVRSPARRARRRDLGLPASPQKVTLTAGGGLDLRALFFTETLDTQRDPLVYAPAAVAGELGRSLGGAAIVVPMPGEAALDLTLVLADLASRGVRRLMVEGGSTVLGQFLAGGLADELSLAVAPVFVGDRAAPRLVSGAHPAGRMRLADVTRAGDVAVLRYLPGGKSGPPG